VLANLSEGIQAPVVRTETLNVGDFVNLESCKKYNSSEDLKDISRYASNQIRVKEIARAAERPGYICLRLDPSPCLARTELTLKVPD
jgi:hypothetical protein